MAALLMCGASYLSELNFELLKTTGNEALLDLMFDL
jgi:hypothetical protein